MAAPFCRRSRVNRIEGVLGARFAGYESMDRATNVVARDATSRLHMIPFSGTIFANHLAQKDIAAGVLAAVGRVRVPAGRDDTSRSRAASGHTPGRHHDRSATVSLDWDRRRRATPAYLLRMIFSDHAPATSQEVRLELSGGVGSLP